MTAPETAWLWSLWALALGAGLGCFFGFLRPLARHRPFLADGIFLPVLLMTWIYHSFAICRGDPGLGYLLMGFLGAGIWEGTGGKKLRPLWEYIWHKIWKIWRTFSGVLKYIFKTMKKCLHIWENGVQ